MIHIRERRQKKRGGGCHDYRIVMNATKDIENKLKMESPTFLLFGKILKKNIKRKREFGLQRHDRFMSQFINTKMKGGN